MMIKTTNATDVQPVLLAWKATYKPTTRARKLVTINAFFAPDYPTALRYAGDVVLRETCGDGVLIKVERTTDPRS